MDFKHLAATLDINPQDPREAELKRYLDAICSRPCPITMEAAISYHVERQKLQRISRCLKALNKVSDKGEYVSEEGVANLPRVQRRYLLRSMESGLRRSQQNRSYFLSTAREEATPARAKRVDPYFFDLLVQWYTERAEEASEAVLAKWDDPVVRALESADKPEDSSIERLENSICTETMVKRVARTPSYSDDESGSDKAASTDEEE